ncbi:response regulator [Deltaproteobacteria bacterium TL4]
MALSSDIHFLVVDDYPKMRAIIRNSLRKLGAEHISEAENGKTALAKLRSEPVHFVISDWNMPEMTGLELLKIIRKEIKLSHLPVLLVTAEATTPNIVEAVKAKVNGYIVKPFTEAVLEEKINEILKNTKFT